MLVVRFRVLGIISLSCYTFYLVLGRCRCLDPIMKSRQGRGLFIPVIDPSVCRYFQVITITCQYLKNHVIFKICRLKEKVFKEPEVRLWVERTIILQVFLDLPFQGKPTTLNYFSVTSLISKLRGEYSVLIWHRLVSANKLRLSTKLFRHTPSPASRSQSQFELPSSIGIQCVSVADLSRGQLFGYRSGLDN